MRLIYLIVMACIPVQAISQATRTLSMEEAVSRAIKFNPRLSAAAREVMAARSGVRSAQSPANPEITFTPGFSAGGSDTELLVRQPLEINGVRKARTAVARAQLNRANAQAVVELRTLVYDTRTAYVALFRAREQARLATEMFQFAVEFDRIARLLVDAGSRPGIESTQTSIELTKAQQQMIQAEADEAVALAVLNTFIGRKPDEGIDTINLPSPSSLDLTNETLIAQALATRAEIVVEESAAEAFRQEARLVRAEGRPDLAPQFRAGTVTRGFSDSGFGIGVVLPLDLGSRRHRIQQMEQGAKAQTDKVGETRNRIRLEVERAITRLRAARSIVASYQQGVIEQSRRLLDASRLGFQEGKTNIVAVMEAQRTFRTIQTDYSNAQANHATAQAELELALGSVPSTLLPEVRK